MLIGPTKVFGRNQSSHFSPKKDSNPPYLVSIVDGLTTKSWYSGLKKLKVYDTKINYTVNAVCKSSHGLEVKAISYVAYLGSSPAL